MTDILEVFKAAESQVEENFQKTVKAWKEALADKEITEVTKTEDACLPFILKIQEKGKEESIGGLHIFKDGRSALVRTVFSAELRHDLDMAEAMLTTNTIERYVQDVNNYLLMEYPAGKFYFRQPEQFELVAQVMYALPFDAYLCSAEHLSADFERAVEAIETLSLIHI